MHVPVRIGEHLRVPAYRKQGDAILPPKPDLIQRLSCIPFILVSPLNETPVRIILGLLLVLFLPGYSLIAALFPGKDGIERIALSFKLSIPVVPRSGLALNYMPFGIRLVPVLLGLSLFTILLALVACVRRRGFPRWSGSWSREVGWRELGLV